MTTIKKKLTAFIYLLLYGSLLVSCTKSYDSRLSETLGNDKSSNVQYFISTVGALRNYVYVDNKPMNGAALTTNTLFPSIGYGFSVPTGMRSFLLRDTLTATTQPQLSFAQNMEIGKSYMLVAYDTITSIKQKTVETPVIIPSDTSARIRFANFVYNPGVIPAVDIYSKNRQQNVFTNVQVTDVTSFIPYESGKADTFYIRPTGTTTNLQNYVTTPAPGAWTDISLIFTPTIRRGYTIIFRGGYRATTSTNATVRGLSVIANY